MLTDTVEFMNNPSADKATLDQLKRTTASFGDISNSGRVLINLSLDFRQALFGILSEAIHSSDLVAAVIAAKMRNGIVNIERL
jgi:hypothetical protein